MRGRITRSVTISALAVAAALVGTPSAAAETEGTVRATMVTENAEVHDTWSLGEPNDVYLDERVRISMFSLHPITGLKVDLEWAGLRLTVLDERTEGTEWERVVEF